MKVDKVTGEILSFLEGFVPYEKDKTLEDCVSNKDLVEIYKEDSKGRILWTNASNNVLRKHLPPDSRHHFESVCQHIPTRNLMFFKVTPMSKEIGLTRKYFYRILEEWECAGLIRVINKNVGEKGNHLYVFNPTVVWKGYLQSGSVDFKEGIPYSSVYRFSHNHKKAVGYWVDMYTTGSYNGLRVYT